MSSSPEQDPAAPKGGEEQVEPKDAVEKALDALKPALARLSMGGVMGYCSGMALKKVGKVLATVIGLGFVGLQTAAYAGYIQVDWAKIGRDSMKPLDSTGDGKFGMDDVKVWWRKVKKILTHELPDASGFAAGFALSIRYS